MKRFSPLSLYLDARHSTSARVFLSIFVSVCLVSLILLSAYSINAMQEMNALSQANGQNVVDTISRQVESFVEDISAMHSLFFSSENILPFLSHSLEEMPSYEWFMDYQAAKRILAICGRSQYSLVKGLLLQKCNGENMQYGSLAYVPDPSQMQQGKLVIDHGYAFFTTSSPLSGGGRTYLTSQLFNAAFDRLCEGLLMPGSGLMILDQQGNPFLRYADNARATEEMDGWLQHGGESQSFSLVKCVSPLSGLTVAMLVPSVTFSAAMADILPWLMPAGLLALLFGLLLSFGFSHRIAAAFRMLKKNIEYVQNSAYDQVTVLPSQDEFGRLSQTFAQMARHIQELILENQRQERTRHALEIQVLRAQVSPHFLYNALGSIRQLASMQGMTHVESLTMAIIHLLRGSLSSAESLVPLSQELEYVRNYWEICRYQYLNDIRITYPDDPSLMDCLLPPMLLQPIVENAIIHGIGDARNDGKILIQAERKGELLRISVTDNGQGMSAEQIEALLRQDSNTNKQRFSGIGLYNVRKRIQMRFGEPSGLQIVSKPGLYTSVVLSLPYQKEHAQ